MYRRLLPATRQLRTSAFRLAEGTFNPPKFPAPRVLGCKAPSHGAAALFFLEKID
jgi:hypothetical protein